MPAFTTGLPAFMSSMSQSAVVSISVAAVTVAGVSVYTIMRASSTRARARRALDARRHSRRAPSAGWLTCHHRPPSRGPVRSGPQNARHDQPGVGAGYDQVPRCAGAGPDLQPVGRVVRQERTVRLRSLLAAQHEAERQSLQRWERADGLHW